jgi:hypothetical protein
MLPIEETIALVWLPVSVTPGTIVALLITLNV